MKGKSINRILEYVKYKMVMDKTITCYGETILNDCDNRVCKESIALRELILYGDFDKQTKSDISSLLNYYVQVLDNDDEHLSDAMEIIKKYIPYINWEEGMRFLAEAMSMDYTVILELGIKEILLDLWQDYEIPSDEYGDITYMHESVLDDTCDRLRYHYKCLHDRSMDWNAPEKCFYQVYATNQDIKTIALRARDSGGHIDVFGYAHHGTTMNCINDFISEQTGINTDTAYDFIAPDLKHLEELGRIAEEIFSLVVNEMDKYNIIIY